METRHHIKQMRKTEKYLIYWRNHLISKINRIINKRYRMEEAREVAGGVQEDVDNIKVIDELLMYHLNVSKKKLNPIVITINTFHEETRDDGIHIVHDEDPYDSWEYTPGEVENP